METRDKAKWSDLGTRARQLKATSSGNDDNGNDGDSLAAELDIGVCFGNYDYRREDFVVVSFVLGKRKTFILLIFYLFFSCFTFESSFLVTQVILVDLFE